MRRIVEPGDIARFLKPDGVALIGRVMQSASPEQLLARERSRWGERFYFVNPSGGSVGDVPIYRSLEELPEPVELAVVSVGVSHVPQVLDECTDHNISNIVIFTGGFAEIGEAGAQLENDLRAQVEALELTVLGPNTNTNAFERMPPGPTTRTGKIGLVTQSGNQGRPFVAAAPQGIVLSRWIATGNEVDLDSSDFIRFFSSDPETTVVGAYIEGFQNGEKLRYSLRAALEAGTPVVMLKMGQTDAGRRMARSHTGHLTGRDDVINGLFSQYAVTRVYDIDELIETTNLFSKLPGHRGDGIGVYGASGGVITLLAENAQRYGLRVPILTEATQQRLEAVLPDYLSRVNPVDNGMQFLMTAPLEQRLEVLRAIGEDPNIDVIVAANNMAEGPIAEAFVEDLTTYAEHAMPVPIVCVWGTSAGDPELLDRLRLAEIPIMRSARAATRSLKSLHDFSCRRDRTFASESTQPQVDVSEMLDGQAGILSQDRARRLLEAVGIKTCEEYLVTSPAEASEAWTKIGAAAVMKVASPDFPHRSDHGLVRLGVSTPDEAAVVYSALLDRASQLNSTASIEGVLVQRQLPEGIELLVGSTIDSVLGAAVTVGFGGTLAEVLADTAVRPVPLDGTDVVEMLQSLRGYRIFEGVRGNPPVDSNAVIEAVMAVATLVSAAKGRLVELDLNPLIVSESGAVAVDVLAVAADS
jgi:acyl-CoA synthetase (NDP forming)